METQIPDDGKARRAKYHRIHLFFFVFGSVALCFIDYLYFEVRWYYWPVMVWGAVFTVHSLYCKALSVDNDWANARADKIHDKSYDIGHINDIEVSYKKSEAAQEIASEEQDKT